MSTDLISLFYKKAAEQPHKKIFTYLHPNKPEQSITYGELDYQAKQIATLLRSFGNPGDTVLLVYPPGLEFITSFIGCAYAGMIIVPVIPPVNLETAHKLKLIIDNAKPVVCLTTKELNNQLNKLKLINQLSKKPIVGSIVNKFGKNLISKFTPLWESHFFSLQWLTTDNLAISVDNFSLAPIDLQAPLFLQYTSGSTGTPKGVVVTHQSVLHNIQLIQYVLNIQEDKDSLYSWLPQYHDMGLIGCILTPIYTGLYTIIDSPFHFLTEPLSWLQGMSKYRCTISAAPNFAYSLCVSKVTELEKAKLDLSHWRVAVNSAEPIRISTLRQFHNCFKECGFKIESFYPSYGLAESTLFVTTKNIQPQFKSLIIDKYELQAGRIKIRDSLDEDCQELVSSGDIDPSINQHQILIVDPQSNIILEEQLIGEIWVSSLSVNPGYWNQDNDEIFQTKFEGQDNSYLRTGDLGFIKDNQLYVTGRIKDLIIIRGKNFYPQDLEHVVEQVHTNIRVGCVNVFSVDSGQQEQLIVLVEIKTKNNYVEICDLIKKHLIQSQRIAPDVITLLEPRTLKKTTSGKVRRREMKQLFINKELPTLFTYQHNSIPNEEEPRVIPPEQLEKESSHNNVSSLIFNSIHQLLRNTPMENISKDSSFAELGFDSLLMAELVGRLQLEFPEQIELPIQDILAISDVGSLIELIQRQLKRSKIPEKSINHSIPTKVYSSEEQQQWMELKHLPEYQKIHQTRTMLGEVANQLYFNAISGISDNCIQLEEKSLINFSGYNYLGYSGDERVIKMTSEAINNYGTSVSASRLVSGQKLVHMELEQAISELIGTEDSVVFSAGHATNVSVITHLFGIEDVIFHDILIHNSSLQGAIFSKAKRIPFPHNDFNTLAKLMEAERSHYRRALVLIEGIYSMDGDIPNVPEFIKVKNQYNAHLMIDEAHSIGVLGEHGEGIREYFNLSANDIELWMGTLSKAFASCGGYISGKKELMDYIRYSCAGFVFSAGISPANTTAALASIQLLKNEPHRPQLLQKNAQKLLLDLKKHGINTGASENTPIIPIIIGDEKKTVQLCLNLRQQGIYTHPIIYPAVERDLARIRLFINYMHTEEQLAYTTEVIYKYLD
ncbi:aminotransferase class I/II-fold pyridoxal phosphate-dependent enzyme [Legionella rowbothamii]|uniref:aminotransferase class I/II-fold pyridoxal phosphate-dependent enzyme n=1 Tax=Legionella rowbothamii TaxID=96229 RepID=UPI001054E217|nr:aminotransferase class I/II-fold pyridoxal phosphate-dependent enzyme [Legionella rowbothamii]